ncbi:glycosyltransferase family 4 protein [Halorarius litoreus]|uniref:glycosyltransferase family 4 protein n=1 Tax=Halorarius litoreus TaxID=2962676 RepID=UPI0020CBA59A|nr:glycosyltransferase family 4 protein [Halorarius litoreus]
MKIIHIYDGHEKIYGEDGSVPKVVWNLAKQAVLNGNDVKVIERAWNGLPEQETDSGVEFRRLDLSTGSSTPWQDIPYKQVRSISGTAKLVVDRCNFAVSAYQLLRRLDYDIIHVHLPFGANVLVTLFPWLATNIVYTAHLGEVKDRITERRFSPDVYLANRTARTVVLNDNMKQSFINEGVNSDSLSIVPNGVDVERFRADQALDGNPVDVLFVGTITPRKGVKELVKAVVDLEEPVRNQMQLGLAGRTDIDEQYYAEVRSLIKQEDLVDHVNFHGFVGEAKLRSLYAEADVFVLPSFEEGFGMVVTEAMAARTAVIGSQVGGIPLQIHNEENGLLIPPGDIGRLSDALKDLVMSEERRKEFAAAGVSKSYDFSWETVYDSYDEIYQAVVAEKE